MYRDRSACVSYQRVINHDSGSENPQFHDKWIDFYHKQETEKEFLLRNKQVIIHGVLYYITTVAVLYCCVCECYCIVGSATFSRGNSST